MGSRIHISWTYFVIFIFSFSCSKAELDKINENPNVPVDVPISLLLPQSIVSTIHGVAGDGAGEYASLFAEHATNVHPPDRHPYDIKATVWGRVYNTLMDLSIIIEKGSEGGSEEGNYVAVGIAKILFAYTLSVGTDMYGDIPFAEALKGNEIRNPKFDGQEDIYNALQNILDEAIDYLDRGNISDITKLDFIYHGNVGLWKKFAYGLKARFYNRLSNIDSDGSARNAITCLKQSFSTENESFIFSEYKQGLTNANPWANWQDGEETYAVGLTIMDVMNKYVPINDDPRANLFFTKIGGDFVGAPPGQSVNDLSHTIFSAPSRQTVLFGAAPQPVLTFDELKFIEAESYFRLQKPDSAYLTYSLAVETACRRAGLAENEIDDYLNQPTVLPGENNLTLQNIIEQKYISFWMFQSIEAYNDMRRTGIPKAIHPAGLPLRLAYPESEVSRNSNTPDNINDVTIYNIPVWWGKH